MGEPAAFGRVAYLAGDRHARERRLPRVSGGSVGVEDVAGVVRLSDSGTMPVVIAPSIVCSVTRKTSYGATGINIVVSFVSPRTSVFDSSRPHVRSHRLGDRRCGPLVDSVRRAPP